LSGKLSDLPDEVRELIQPHMPASDTDAETSVLDAIGVQIASLREEAKGHRSGSGIESTWRECEESYLGIDDANRHEFTDARWAKPMSMDGPVTTERRTKNTDHRSTVFLRLTSRYVDAGAAKLGEILLPADEKAFSFSEMPVPELIEAKNDESQVVHSELGAPLTRPLAAGEAPPAQAVAGTPGQPPAGQRVPLKVKDLAMESIEIARKKAKAAESRIYDWMVQTQFRAELRKVIGDAARIGVGVFKAPTPVPKKMMVVLQGENDSISLGIRETVVPAGKWCDPWDIFPAPGCGENIHDGDYIFERDHMSARQVRGLKKLPGYITTQIDRVLEEGPNKINSSEGAERNRLDQKGRFQVWYFYGTLTRDQMAAIDQAAGKSVQQTEDGTHEAHAIVTLINDSVVRATINPLDSGEFPHHSMPWSRRDKHWAGVGVAEQMRAPQRVTNAALRGLLNNAGKSAGCQLVIDEAAIRPADGNWTITPDKIWLKTMDGPADVRQAMAAILIPNVTAQMMEIITMGERFAEETTSIPLITQGQSGATTPDTFGAAQLQNNNANQLLRSIGYAFDDYITEPVVRQYYEWLLLDPDVPNDEKGEWQIDAHGSAALVERAIQDQTIWQMLSVAANPIFGIDPKKLIKLALASKHLDASDVQYSEEEQARIDAAPPPEAPAVTVAKIAADTEMKKLAASQTADQQSLASEERIVQAAHALEGQKLSTQQQAANVDATVRLHELQTRHDLALLDYANQHKISLDNVKAMLAKTAMQLQTERDLNAANNASGDRKHRRETAQRNMPKPPVQAPGRAANGHAADQTVQ